MRRLAFFFFLFSFTVLFSWSFNFILVRGELPAADSDYAITADWIKIGGTYFTGSAGIPETRAATPLPSPSHPSFYDPRMIWPTPENPAPLTSSSEAVSLSRRDVSQVDGLVTNAGGISMTKFIPYTPTVLRDGRVEYKARARYSISIIIRTDPAIQNVFSNFKNLDVETRWFAAYCYENYDQRDNGLGSWKVFDAMWEEKTWNQVKSYWFKGNVDLDFELDPIPETSDIENIPENEVQVGSEGDNIRFVQDFRWGNIEVTRREYGNPVETYIDTLSVKTDETSRITTFNKDSASSSLFNDAASSVQSKLDGLYVRLSETATQYHHIQRGYVESTAGAGSNIGRGAPDARTVTAKIPVNLRPEISYIGQNVEVRGGMFYIDTYQEKCLGLVDCGFSGIERDEIYQYNSKSPIIRGARVNNRWMRITFEVNGYFTTYLQATGVKSRSVLEDPAQLSSDFVWNGALGGGTGGAIGFGEDDFLGFNSDEILTVLIIAGIVGLVIYIFTTYMKSRSQRVVIQQAVR